MPRALRPTTGFERRMQAIDWPEHPLDVNRKKRTGKELRMVQYMR
jgi:hypothetical protein